MIEPFTLLNFYPSPSGGKNHRCTNRSSIVLLDQPRDFQVIKFQKKRTRPNASPTPPTSSLSSSAPAFLLHHNAYDKVIHTLRNGLLCILILSSSCCDADARQLLLERPSTNTTTTVEEEVATLFDKWNDALMTKDPEIISNLYDEQDGVLVPTLSNQIRYNKKGIKDYFMSFMSKDPVGRVVESQTVVEGNVAVRSGIYMFTLGSEGGKEVPARFTFVYRRAARKGSSSEGGEWRIIAHHSSLFPETGMSSK